MGGGRRGGGRRKIFTSYKGYASNLPQTQVFCCSVRHTVSDDSLYQYLWWCIELGPEDVSLLERCPHFRGWYVQASMELGPEDVSLLERCPHFNPPLSESFKTTSEISNIFIGRGIFLLADMVFSIPGNSVVLATYLHTERDKRDRVV